MHSQFSHVAGKIKHLLYASWQGKPSKCREGLGTTEIRKQSGASDLISGGYKLGLGVKWLGIAMLCAATASCSTTSNTKKKPTRSKEYFSESEYGVKASPRVAEGANIPKGGGRFLVGNAYTVKGQRYFPKEDPGYDKSGLASWYGSAFHGRQTANGEVYDSEHLSAAHPTFPLPSYARVTNTDTGSSVIVRVNDRGPFHPGRIIDVSSKTADLLDMKGSGTANVRVQYVGRARMDGHDMPYLMASYLRKGDRNPGVLHPEGQIATGVMVASANPRSMPASTYSGSTQMSLTASPQSRAIAAMPLVTGASQTPEQFAVLPEIGPVLQDRPESNFLRLPSPRFASAYTETAANTPAGHSAFDAIMVRNDGLTEQSILAFTKKQRTSER
jgi:rare lipoprotein A